MRWYEFEEGKTNLLQKCRVWILTSHLEFLALLLENGRSDMTWDVPQYQCSHRSWRHGQIERWTVLDLQIPTYCEGSRGRWVRPVILEWAHMLYLPSQHVLSSVRKAWLSTMALGLLYSGMRWSGLKDNQMERDEWCNCIVEFLSMDYNGEWWMMKVELWRSDDWSEWKHLTHVNGFC